ncbi:MAG: threonylcarbamoyl-AMP synthase [Planctomycetaceae bacterium]|nr:MAG: threonylcarbamoyl-AMP synthase [Planctomycetaceae bacterium]
MAASDNTPIDAPQLFSEQQRAEIASAAAILRAGGVGAFPTETVYGLGASAFDDRAVARVFEVKGRPRFDPLIVHLAGIDWVDRVAREFPDRAARLARRFWPGPLTLVLPKRDAVSDLVTAGLDTVAVRVPDHPVAQALLEAAGVPIAAPSANPFGMVSPTTAEHVREQLGSHIDFVLDGGPCRVGVESTVLLVDDQRLTLLRPGGTTVEEIEDCLGKVHWSAHAASPDSAAGLIAPGTLERHYSPRTPLRVLDAGTASQWATGGDEVAVKIVPGDASFTRGQCGVHDRQGVGLLAFTEPAGRRHFDRVEVLSARGDLREAAAGFFAALRRLDAAGLELIVAEWFPEAGLGRALNDRLRRAAARG